LLVQVRHVKDQYGYTAQTVGKTIMFPISQKYLGNFFDVALPWLMYWKVIITYQIMLYIFFFTWYLLLTGESSSTTHVHYLFRNACQTFKCHKNI